MRTKTDQMLDNVFNQFSERRAVEKDNVAHSGSINLQAALRHVGSIVYKLSPVTKSCLHLHTDV